jgi:two-component system phosphate regulon sensor histidine kinase PhoR
LAYVSWRLEILPSGISHLVKIVGDDGGPPVALNVEVAAVLPIVSALSVGVLIQRFGMRRSWLGLLTSFVALTSLCAVAVRFFGIDLLFGPLIAAGVVSAVLVQINRLAYLDRQLVSTLLQSPTAFCFHEYSDATTRLTSGLKLLSTVLPLTEIIVYECVESNSLETVARFKGSANRSAENSRNSVWRDGIKLCEEALAAKDLVTQKVENSTASNVAIPLLHEHETVGVLLARLRTEFCNDDKPLLEAVSSQFARNLKRESLAKNPARPNSLNIFSQTGSQKKLDALFVLRALAIEQRGEANALAQIDDGVAIAHLDGTLAFTNPAVLRFAQLNANQVPALDLFGLLDKFRTGVFDEPAIAVRRVLQTGTDYEGELNFESRNEILRLRISLLREKNTEDPESSEPVGVAIYVKDLTRVKEYEKLKSDMISLMSHELRTPLTSINGFAELLTVDETLAAQPREFVTIIANESQRMSRMINTFLAVTQLERKDKQEVLKIPLRLDEVVRETITTLQPIAKKKRIRLVEQPAQRIPPVAADRSLITQAVKNLVNNAIKYSPERTTVTVSTALEAEAVRVCVEDRGFGIPAESRERVWEKFYRVVREGQEKDEESTGLGLSFVREVVEQHGGRVELDSEEGRGSKFSFTLPRL